MTTPTLLLDPEDLELLADGTTVVAEAIAAGLEPEPYLTVSEWADKHRQLPQSGSDEWGQYRTERTPYMREIMDALSVRSPVERVVFMKGSQIGATEAANNWLGYVIHHAPGPFLYVEPSLDIARDVVRQRLQPMFDSTPELKERVSAEKSRNSENTVLRKKFANGFLAMRGANSASGFRNLSARNLCFDDADGAGPEVGGEGDPLQLAITRTRSYSASRKIFIISTPTTAGASRIEREFAKSDQRYFEVPCPHCGAFQTITYAKIRAVNDPLVGAVFDCRDCEREIYEYQKPEMLSAGVWVATAEGDGRTRGYHLSALYSPWYTWADAIADHRESKASGTESLKTWINTVLAEVWQEEGTIVDHVPLLARCEKYPARVPDGALVLTCGADIQENRIELEVVGWGAGEESWGIEYRVLWGDPSQPAIWKELQEVLDEKWQREDGTQLRIAAACIDSGFMTKKVYRFCFGKEARRIFAVKGVDGVGKPITSSSKRKRSGRDRRHLTLQLVGTDQARSLVHSRLGAKEGDAGYCHFPLGRGYDENFFQQLTAMKAVIKYRKGIGRREWVQTSGRRKEAFDCRIYALAALDILHPNFGVMMKRRDKPKETETKIEEPKPDEPEVIAKPRREKPATDFMSQQLRARRRSRSGGGWAKNWKRGW